MPGDVNAENTENRKYKKRQLPPGHVSKNSSILKQSIKQADLDESMVTSESYFDDDNEDVDEVDDIDRSKLFGGDSFFDDTEVFDNKAVILKKLNPRSVQSPSNSLYMPGRSYVRVNSKISGPANFSNTLMKNRPPTRTNQTNDFKSKDDEYKREAINTDIPDYYKNIDWKKLCQSYLNFGVQGDVCTPFREACGNQYFPNPSNTAPKPLQRTLSQDCDLDFYFNEFQKCFLSQRKRAKTACSNVGNITAPNQIDECKNDNFYGDVGADCGLIGDIGEDSFCDQVRKWCYEDMAKRKQLKQHLKRQQAFKQTFTEDKNKCLGQTNGDMLQLQMQQSQLKALLLQHRRCQQQQQEFRKNHLSNGQECCQQNVQCQCLQQPDCQMQPGRFLYIKKQNVCQPQGTRIKPSRNKPSQSPQEPGNCPGSFKMSQHRRKCRVTCDGTTPIDQSCPDGIMTNNLPKLVNNIVEECSISPETSDVEGVGRQKTSQLQCPQQQLSYLPPKQEQHHSQILRQSKLQDHCQEQKSSDPKSQLLDLCNDYLNCSFDRVDKKVRSNLKRERESSNMPDQVQKHDIIDDTPKKNCSDKSKFDQDENSSNWSSDTDKVKVFYCKCKTVKSPKHGRKCNLDDNLEEDKAKSNQIGPNSAKQSQKSHVFKNESCSSSTTSNKSNASAMKSPSRRYDCKPEERFSSLASSNKKAKTSPVKSSKHDKKCYIIMNDCSDSCIKCKCKCYGLKPLDKKINKPKKNTNAMPNTFHQRESSRNELPSCSDSSIVDECSETTACEAECPEEVSEKNPPDKINNSDVFASDSDNSEENVIHTCRSTKSKCKIHLQTDEHEPVQKYFNHSPKFFECRTDPSQKYKQSGKSKMIESKLSKLQQDDERCSSDSDKLYTPPITPNIDDTGLSCNKNGGKHQAHYSTKSSNAVKSQMRSNREAILRSTSGKAKDLPKYHETDCEDSNSCETLTTDHIGQCSDQMCDAVTDEVFGKLLHLCKKNKLSETNKCFLDDNDALMNSMIKCLYFLNCIMKFDNLKKKYCRSVETSKSKNRKIK